jgi:hypothetical protein
VGAVGGAATQEIPPRVRRLVMRRDHGRCSVPGCRAAKYLHIHHVVPREAGGGHDPSNLTTLCSADHRAAHRGALVIRGRAPDELVFHRPAAASRSGESDPVARDVVGALRRMGVAASDAQRAFAATGLTDGRPIEEVIRGALQHLARTTYASACREPAAVWTSGQAARSARRASASWGDDAPPDVTRLCRRGLTQ